VATTTTTTPFTVHLSSQTIGFRVPCAPKSSPSSSSGSFSITLPTYMLPPGGGGIPRPHHFSVSTLAGPLSVGEKVPVVFSFDPNPAPASGGPGGSSHLKKGGEWQEIEATLVLQGGVIVSGGGATRVIRLLLRAFLPGTDSHLDN